MNFFMPKITYFTKYQEKVVVGIVIQRQKTHRIPHFRYSQNLKDFSHIPRLQMSHKLDPKVATVPDYCYQVLHRQQSQK